MIVIIQLQAYLECAGTRLSFSCSGIVSMASCWINSCSSRMSNAFSFLATAVPAKAEMIHNHFQEALLPIASFPHLITRCH
jgi:hypothetical protein